MECERLTMDATEPLPPGVEYAQVVTFLAPRQVIVRKTPLHKPLKPTEVLVRARYSAISAGTEMLVWNGTMPKDIATDAVFSEMNAAPFSYPATYGYASVGVVAECGGSVQRWKVGDRVFAFREHCSLYVAGEESLFAIPENVSDLEACFFPNVETAVSLAMDMAISPGDNVCVVGQGIIGLLLDCVLQTISPFTRVAGVDTNQARCGIAQSSAGTVCALDPTTPNFLSELRRHLGEPGADISVDVSGSGQGLETAIKATRDVGRVVIGSWYGDKQVSLSCLGGRFHRSHMTLVASQVSAIPPHLGARWSKDRRFRLVWRILGELQVIKRFPIHIVSISDAPTVYAEVARAEHLQVLFRHSSTE